MLFWMTVLLALPASAGNIDRDYRQSYDRSLKGTRGVSFRDPLVRDAWKGLGELGFDPGPPDSLLGDKMKKAIMDFQTKEGLEATGVLSPSLVDRIYARVAEQGRESTDATAKLMRQIWMDAIERPGDLAAQLEEMGDLLNERFRSCLDRVESKLRIPAKQHLGQCWGKSANATAAEQCSDARPELQVWFFASSLKRVLEEGYSWERTTAGGLLFDLHSDCDLLGEQEACGRLSVLRTNAAEAAPILIRCEDTGMRGLKRSLDF
jgi:peptidoglycan hydrolase-like protein with peptidoglycan-binding domain